MQGTHRRQTGRGGVLCVVVDREAQKKVAVVLCFVICSPRHPGRQPRHPQALAQQMLEVYPDLFEHVRSPAADQRFHRRGRRVVPEREERYRAIERLRCLRGHRLRRQGAHLVVGAGQPVDERLRVPASALHWWRPAHRLLKRLAPDRDVWVRETGNHRAGRVRNVRLELGEAENPLEADSRNRILQARDDAIVIAQERRRPDRGRTIFVALRGPKAVQQLLGASPWRLAPRACHR